jgi:hypothetical protein
MVLSRNHDICLFVIIVVVLYTGSIHLFDVAAGRHDRTVKAVVAPSQNSHNITLGRPDLPSLRRCCRGVFEHITPTQGSDIGQTPIFHATCETFHLLLQTINIALIMLRLQLRLLFLLLLMLL